MKVKLSLFLAGRYFRTQRRGTGNASTLLSVLGIAVGVMTLTVVLAIMNGFQLGFIENIVEISSYHLQARATAPGTKPPEDDTALANRIRALPGVTAVVAAASVMGKASDTQAARDALQKVNPKDQINWDRLMVTLNNDKDLLKAVGKLPTKCPFRGGEG